MRGAAQTQVLAEAQRMRRVHLGFAPRSNAWATVAPMTSSLRRLGRTRSRLPVLSAAVVAMVAATIAFVAGPAGAAHNSPAKAFAPPAIKHVWTIVLENKSYEAAFTGLNQNSYLWQTLPSYGELQRQYYGTGHFSEDNYLSMVSGQGASPGPQADCPMYNNAGPGTIVADNQAVVSNGGCVFPANVPTLFNQFDANHVSYKGYMQDMGNDVGRENTTCGAPGGVAPGATVVNNSPSATATDQYVAKHNPFPWFHSLLDNGDCAKHVVPLAKNLLQDLKHEDTTPAYSFITPNNCSDAHDATCKGDNLSGGSNALTGTTVTPANNQGGLYAADLFLEQIIPAIMKSPAYQDGGLIDVTFDEGFPPYKQYGNSIADKDATPTDTSQSIVACCNELTGPNTDQPGDKAFGQSTTPGGGITGAVLISPFITPGSVSDQPYNHYSYLRSMEDLFHITTGGNDGKGHLAYAGADGLRPFGPDVYNNPKARPLQPTLSGEGGVYAAQATLTTKDKPVSYQPLVLKKATS